uniref:Methyltransferase type 11 domain-containing protein n=2 Tax=Marmotini TaxID=337730 RepID=A0A8C9PUT9_SPEDA
MEFCAARRAILQLLCTVAPADRPALLQWMRTTRDFDEFTQDNNDIMLKNIADDLRNCLPLETMLSSEHLALQKIQQQPKPTVHVDAFLYDEDFIDSLCEEGKMSRNYCMVCGSHQTAPLGFISHSFSLMELKFIYHHVLPDLSGKVLVDVGSRLGTVLFGGYLYSSAEQLYGVELNGDFCQLQEMVIKKYQFNDRIKVLHADICTQGSLLQNADVVIMNNVFEYFLNEEEQARAWEYISHNVRKQGSLLLTVPSLEESLSVLQTNIQLSPWVKEVPLNYDECLPEDTDREALEQIHLYEIL